MRSNLSSARTREIAPVRRPVAVEPPRVNVLGVGVHAVNMERAIALLDSAIKTKTKGLICVTGVHGVMESQRDAGLKAIINRSLITLPDGRPMLWVGRLRGHQRMTQVTGPDFMLAVCERSQEKGYTHFLYGGKPGVAEELKRSLESRFAGLRIVGTYTPPFRALSQQEQHELSNMMSDLRPDIMWVGISTPKQERFMAENLNKLTATVMVGVGAAFDLHTGHIKDAPRWMKEAGLQWFHRLLQDPRRLWRRYLVNNTFFLGKILFQLSRLKTYDLA